MNTENRAFFYVDGIPTKGGWIDLDTITGFDEVAEELAEAGYIPLDEDGEPDYGGDILCACAEGLAGEFTGSSDIFDMDGFIECRDECRDHEADEEAKAAYVSLFGEWSGSDFDDRYRGEWSSDEAFAQDMADDTGAISDNAQWPYTCIDWEHAARELMYDFSEESGHYFWNC